LSSIKQTQMCPIKFLNSQYPILFGVQMQMLASKKTFVLISKPHKNTATLVRLVGRALAVKSQSRSNPSRVK